MYESSSVDYQQLEMPSVAGAKLVGIFEDDHKANAKGKAVKSGKHNYTYWPNHLNMEKRHYCKEVIFEDSGLRFVPSTKPSCMLGHDDDDRRHLQLKRQKRSTNTQVHLPLYFQIPAKPNDVNEIVENIDDDSYIKVRMRVCSEPGGEVIVNDVITETILDGFRNLGGSRQCNKWVELPENNKNKQLEELAFEKFISESNLIQVEYKPPTDMDVFTIKWKSSFLKNGHGSRMLQYLHKKTEEEVFSLEVKYEVIPFRVDPEDPEVLMPDPPEGPISPAAIPYRANWVKTYSLGRRSLCDMSGVTNCQEKFRVGIQVEIERLDLDFDRGDYLIVGPGIRPEFWKNSKGQAIAQPIGVDKDDPQQGSVNIWINADSAFLRIVTHNSLRETTNDTVALKFNWIPANDTLPDMKVDEVSQKLKEASLQVCLIEYQCTVFKPIEDAIKKEAVRIFNQYLMANDKSITTLIDETSVLIFDPEQFSYPKGRRTEYYCQFNLAIASPYDSEFPLVGSDIIYKMLFPNGGSRQMIRSSNSTVSVTINNCEFELISWKTIFIPIVIILAISISIMLIFWRLQSKVLQNDKNYHRNQSQSERFIENEQKRVTRLKDSDEINQAMQY